jgi:hypothetical protein
VIARDDDGARLEVLGRDECWSYLLRQGFGRVGAVVDGRPAVFPVNYTVSDAEVVFRVGSGTLLRAVADRSVAFEVDGHDVRYHEGWSVLVAGTARDETDPERRLRLEELPLRPWAGGVRDHWVCIPVEEISGRRLVHVAGREGGNDEPERAAARG